MIPLIYPTVHAKQITRDAASVAMQVCWYLLVYAGVIWLVYSMILMALKRGEGWHG